jgi:hypothetical protein
MANLSGFDANRVEPSTDYDPLPAGKYLAVITESEMKPTKSGTGSYLQFTFEILDGQFKGRKVWARLNLANSNEMTVKIAQAELSAICRAVGVLAPNDSVELHNLPLVIAVKCKKRPDTGEISNEVRGFAKKETPQPTPSTPGTSPTPSANGTPPWKR